MLGIEPGSNNLFAKHVLYHSPMAISSKGPVATKLAKCVLLKGPRLPTKNLFLSGNAEDLNMDPSVCQLCDIPPSFLTSSSPRRGQAAKKGRQLPCLNDPNYVAPKSSSARCQIPAKRSDKDLTKYKPQDEG